MLPESSLNTTGEIASSSDRAYFLDFENKCVGGIISGKEALIQAIRMALLTQRYKYSVFSHSYGTEIEECMGLEYVKMMGRLKKAITESLLCDERIISLDSFEFEKRGARMDVKFRVNSIYGNVDYKTEVE